MQIESNHQISGKIRKYLNFLEFFFWVMRAAFFTLKTAKVNPIHTIIFDMLLSSIVTQIFDLIHLIYLIFFNSEALGFSISFCMCVIYLLHRINFQFSIIGWNKPQNLSYNFISRSFVFALFIDMEFFYCRA